MGAMCGADLIVQAGLVTAFVLATNRLLRYRVLYLNTRPTNTDDTKYNYHLYVVCERTGQAEVLAKLQHPLDSSGYPARSVEKHALDASDTEIEVLLMTIIARAEQLNAITKEMEQLNGVKARSGTPARWQAKSSAPALAAGSYSAQAMQGLTLSLSPLIISGLPFQESLRGQCQLNH